jgi:hypothetical protein
MRVVTRTAWVHVLVGCLAAVWSGGRLIGASEPALVRGSQRAHDRQFQPAFPVMSMIALADDQLLVWHGDGRAQLRTTSGAWTEMFQLPVHAIMDVKPDEAGFLITGAIKPGTSVVLAMTAQGRELDRWVMDGHDTYRLVVDSRSRRAVTREGMVPLLAGGKLGTVDAWPPQEKNAFAVPPTLIVKDDVTIIWREANLSRQHRTAGSFERIGPAGWRFEGDFIGPPICCGEWLIYSERSRGSGPVVRSVRSGAVENRIENHAQAVIACAGSNRVLVGDRELSLLELPAGKVLWTQPIAGAQIADLAVMNNFVAYRVHDSTAIFLTSLPR